MAIALRGSYAKFPESGACLGAGEKIVGQRTHGLEPAAMKPSDALERLAAAAPHACAGAGVVDDRDTRFRLGAEEGVRGVLVDKVMERLEPRMGVAFGEQFFEEGAHFAGIDAAQGLEDRFAAFGQDGVGVVNFHVVIFNTAAGASTKQVCA